MHALIMAGGIGKRFWPMSRTKRPKQFLNLFGDDSMIRMTFDRLQPLIKPEKIVIITNKHQKDLTIKHLPGLPPENIICEPLGKDTAPCIGLGALHAISQDPDAVQIVLPADHLIKDVKEFQRIMEEAAELAAKKDCLITVGIKPSRPETGYGYIQWDDRGADDYLPEEFHGKGFLKVKTFAEKPNLATAKRFIHSGDFLWNSGIFIWKAKTILNEMEESLPEIHDSLMQVKKYFGKKGFQKALLTAYRQIKSISIDYGIMEKSHNVFLLKGDFGWSDVGSWAEFFNLKDKDESGNVIIGQCELRDSKNNLVISDKGLIAGVGIEDFVIVQSDNVVLLCPRNRSQEIKEIVDFLTRKNMSKYL